MFNYFVSPETMDAVSDPDSLVKHDPYQAVKFDALKEMRANDDGTLYKGAAFRHVASIQAPLEHVLRLLDPEFMKEKRNFYSWMDRGNNKAYCVYDRRSAASRQAQFERDFGHLLVKGETNGVHDETNGAEAASLGNVELPSGPGEIAAGPGLHDRSEEQPTSSGG
jgi:hypothetical protein